ncbi:hypothetical protein PVAP13_6KG356906 [Panicum virgatum]|uniref:Uncharacterized protein n=1 Tax=Panicum virgatum TaxID=38727 RepID=A0A8T0RJ66_PANVG|nr:hypothetical protein PVAP13_6KG356906 [Panicum virgatum]
MAFDLNVPVLDLNEPLLEDIDDHDTASLPALEDDGGGIDEVDDDGVGDLQNGVRDELDEGRHQLDGVRDLQDGVRDELDGVRGDLDVLGDRRTRPRRTSHLSLRTPTPSRDRASGWNPWRRLAK